MSHAPNASYSFSEVFARPTGFAICGAGTDADFQAIEDMIYQKTLAAVDAIDPAQWGSRSPRGIGFDDDYIQTTAARNRINSYLAVH